MSAVENVAEIGAHAAVGALGLENGGVAFRHHLLDRDRALDRRDARGEFEQNAGRSQRCA
jgi:hypothetical protein